MTAEWAALGPYWGERQRLKELNKQGLKRQQSRSFSHLFLTGSRLLQGVSCWTTMQHSKSSDTSQPFALLSVLMKTTFTICIPLCFQMQFPRLFTRTQQQNNDISATVLSASSRIITFFFFFLMKFTFQHQESVYYNPSAGL